MPETLDHWDIHIAPYLKEMEVDARYVKHYTGRILSRVARLERKPEFITKAETEITESIKMLRESADALEHVLGRYKAKPVIE